MADSYNSMSLSTVTRRKLLAGTMIATLPWPAAGQDAEPSTPDATIPLWRAWREAHERTDTLCRRQQRLETMLAHTVGFPSAEVYLPDQDEVVTVRWPEEIEELLGDEPALADIRATTEAEFAAHRARWEEADARLGYSAAKRAEEAASCDEHKLADALYNTPAASLAGVAAKLDAILQQGQWCEDCPEFPWPQLRAVLNDIVTIGGDRAV